MLCIDLFCGLGGWTEGFLAEGWRVVGFDIERHQYGSDRYPAQLVLQDVLTLDGFQFAGADCIVASPPCQEFSYMAMPWTRAKQIAAALREEVPFPEGYTGSRTRGVLTALFDASFRIQREACAAAGRYIPMVVENVKGAQPWVGKAQANFGSYYLWGDVGQVGGRIVIPDRMKVGEYAQTVRARKNDGGSWFAVAHNTNSGTNCNPVNGRKVRDAAYQPGAVMPAGVGSTSWFHGNTKHELRGTSSHSQARKAASAQIAKIPFPLSSFIARSLKPQ